MQQSYGVWRLILLVCGTLALPARAAPEQALDVARGERLLILAPHPDDESLSAAGLAQRVLANGGSVRAVVATAGDAYVDAVVQETGKRKPAPADYLAFGERRLEESRRAAQVLGKGFLHLDLLGFSDGSLYPALVSHWRRNRPMRSDFTGFDHVPYSVAIDRGYAQDGQDLLGELLAILRDTRPTMIAFPDVMENDSDHAGLGMFALLAVHDWLARESARDIHPKLLAYLIHWRPGWPTGSNWGIAQDWSQQPMRLPDDLPLRGHQRVCLNLTPAEVATKRQAMTEYQTQQLIMGDFLASFVRSSECFTLLQTGNTERIENVVEHWRHVRKTFDNHPLTRRKI